MVVKKKSPTELREELRKKQEQLKQSLKKQQKEIEDAIEKTEHEIGKKTIELYRQKPNLFDDMDFKEVKELIDQL